MIDIGQRFSEYHRMLSTFTSYMEGALESSISHGSIHIMEVDLVCEELSLSFTVGKDVILDPSRWHHEAMFILKQEDQ